MIKQIRDDVINLNAYVAAAFKYDDELTTLYEVGGYCLLSQCKEKYGTSKSKRMLEELQDLKLISTEYYSNAKYIYISQNGIKYLSNKNNSTDIVRIYNKRIQKYPGEKVLIASILKYQIVSKSPHVKRNKFLSMLQKNIMDIKNINNSLPANLIEINKEKYIKSKDSLNKFINIILQNNPKEEIKDIINVAQNKYVNTIKKYDRDILEAEQVQAKLLVYQKNLINLFDMSKIIILPKDNETLEYYILDYTKIKPCSKYFEHVYKFEKTIGKVFKNINIYFVSYKKERFEKFKSKLNIYLTKNNYRNVELIEVPNCYKLEKIIERTNYTKKEIIEIKPKDKVAFEQLKKEFSKE